MASEAANVDSIPCEICQQYFPFEQYQVHVASHNNNPNNNNNNNNKPMSMLIPCEYASCNQQIPMNEYESHLLLHTLSMNNNNNPNNNSNNNNNNNNNNNIKNEIIYVACTEANCNQQIPLDEFDSHLLTHQLSNNKNNNNDNNNNKFINNDDDIIVPCDYPSCNVKISLKDWESHILSHSKMNNQPQNEEKNEKIPIQQHDQHQSDSEQKDEKIEEKKQESKLEQNDEKNIDINIDVELKENIDITQFLCVTCQQTQGHDIHCSLSHKLCIECATKYISDGIESNKWKTQLIKCPANNCKDGVLPSWLINDCNLSKEQMSKLDSMQNEYIKFMDPTITSCPKCNETYSTEVGDMQNDNKDELAPNGKVLSMKHKQHKIKYRFRCSKGGCKTIFCSGCKAIPYHIGFNCEEYKQYIVAKKCRFCEVELNDKNIVQKGWFEMYKSGLDDVCNAIQCTEKRKISCDLVYDTCGHNCIGMRGYECFDCLNVDCLPKNADVTQEEYCNICWVDPLKAAPCIRLECNHYFHFGCLQQKVDKKWPAARITFNFLNCPLCKRRMSHPALKNISQHLKLEQEIQKDAVNRVRIEGLQNDKRLTDKSSRYYNDINKYAMDRLAFYLCFKCKKAYFGGMKACEEAGMEQEEKYNENHLICGACACGDKRQTCNVHGTEYISWKCKYCCALAIWFCWGNTHFCDPCHRKAYQLKKANINTIPKCKGKDKCPLGIQHPANGTKDCCLGCVVCLRK